MKLRDEKRPFHFFFLVLLKLEAFQIKGFEKVLDCNFTPVLDSVNLFNTLQLVDLTEDSISEYAASLDVSDAEEPLEFFLLFPM